MLPSLNDERASERAEMARKALWDLGLEHKTSPVAARVKLSIVVAVKRLGMPGNARQLLPRADGALCRAKQNVRNQVVLATR